jgi:hypothetical protein
MTMQWGPIFWEDGMRIASLIDTKTFASIQYNSRVVDLFVLGGTGDLEVLKKKYINTPFNEFEQLIKKLNSKLYKGE